MRPDQSGIPVAARGAASPRAAAAGHVGGGVGVAIITYNRRDTLMRCVAAVEEHTLSPYHLVIADDGSRDGSAEWARSHGLPVVTGENRGPGWNKNRALLYLLERTPCDPLILLEEECQPTTDGWEIDWVAAGRRWQQVNYARPEWRLKSGPGGAGTPEDPFLHTKVTGQCHVVTREGLARVGFLDPRFRDFGYEHQEWSYRFWRAYGPCGDAPRWRCINTGLRVRKVGTYLERETFRKNRDLMVRLRDGDLYRTAWRNEEERQRHRREQQRACWAQRPETGVPGLVSILCMTQDPAAVERFVHALAGSDRGGIREYEVIWVRDGSRTPDDRSTRSSRCRSAEYLSGEGGFRYEAAINCGVMNSGGAIILAPKRPDFAPDVPPALLRDAGRAAETGMRVGPWGDADWWAVDRASFCASGGMDETAAGP